VVVLAYDFWKTELGGAADVIGRKVLVNQHPMTVVGVAAPWFRGIDVGEVPALWIPASMSADAIPGFKRQLDRRTRWMQVLGRLRMGLTAEQAQAGLQPWFKAMLETDMRLPGFPRIIAERRRQFLSSILQVTPAPQGHSSLRRQLSQPLWVLFASTAFLLGLACLNVAGLFVARGSAREREISTRLALGASRGRIGRQFLADSTVLSFAGGLVGVGLAPFAMRALIAFLPRDTAANALQSGVDPALLLFALIVSVAAGLVSGLVPALHGGRGSLISSLRERGGSAFGAGRLRKLIVTLQIAVSLVLLTGAMLFVRTLSELMAKGPGFETSSLVSFGLNARRNGYSNSDGDRLMRRVHDELRTAPIVESASLARWELLTGGSWNDPITIQSDRRIETDRDVNLNAVTPGFFKTLGIKIVAGRDFDQWDVLPANAKGLGNVIVSEAFVKRYLAGRNPLGVRVCEGSGPDARPDSEIIGVVTDFSYRGLREESEQLFTSFSGGFGTFYVKVRGTPAQALQSVRSIVHDADPALPLLSFRTVNEQINRSLNTERLLATLSAAFGTLALLLSLVGIYGVMSFVVTQRTREIGIRMALGANRGAAIWLVLRDASIMVAAGAALGLPSIAALGRLVQSQLYAVNSTDPLTIGLATVLLAVAAIGAALIPAYRACTLNPTDALRLD
jgi:predicted permease